MAVNQVLINPVVVDAYGVDSSAANARAVLTALLLVAVCVVAGTAVSVRSIEVGSDTHVYAWVFLAMRDAWINTRFEPGFSGLTRLASATGMSLVGYQATLFGVLMAGALLAARRYFDYLRSNRDFLTFLCAVVLCLLVSPMFVNASINAVRQGLAAPLVFAAMLSFHHRHWRAFVLTGAVASSLHYSSLIYLAFAPVLLLNLRTQRIIAAVAFLAYCSGLSMALFRMGVPAVYSAVMSYSSGATYRAGVRLDFAVFSLFWYVLPFLLSRLIREPFDERIKQSAAVYMAMVLPFLAVGWGNYSNRFLLVPWVAVSFMVAAMLCHARTPLLRDPLLLRVAMLPACGIFWYYVTHLVLI